jgi:hypothetical protein
MTLDNLRKKLSDKFDNKLSRTLPLNELPDEMKSFLEGLYDAPELSARLFATLLNAIYSDPREEVLYTFLMSKNLMSKLVESDHKAGNLQRGTINSEEYTSFAALLITREIIELVNPSEQKSSQHPNGLAGTWRLVDRDARRLLERSFPMEPNEDGFPSEQLEHDEMVRQWITGGHADAYADWIDNQYERELRIERAKLRKSEADGSSESEPLKQKKPIKIY